jgi:hypothetical protein
MQLAETTWDLLSPARMPAGPTWMHNGQAALAYLIFWMDKDGRTSGDEDTQGRHLEVAIAGMVVACP